MNEVNYLKSWISDRLDWLDSQFALIIPLSVDDKRYEPVASGSHVSVYPNPFDDRITLSFKLDKSSNVDVIILNVLGETIIHQSKVCASGLNQFNFEGEHFNQSGNIFFYSLVVDGEIIQSGKMVKY
jgi:hypothetical protein